MSPSQIAVAVFAAAVSLAGCGEDSSSPSPSTGGSGGAPSGGAGPAGGEGGGEGNAGGAGGDDPIGGGGSGNTGPTKSPGCTSGSGLAEGEHSFTLDDLERRFIVRLPVGYTADQPWPVVLALHGNGGSVEYWDVTSGPRNIRAVLENDAVLIIVEAIEGNWRDYDMAPDTWPARIEQELAYFEEVLTRAKDELCINEDAIFSMGFSGGGSFSGVLGCHRADIRAIAVGGSVIYFEEEDCAYAPAAWITIGEMEMSPAREAFRDFFRDRAMCEPTSMATDPAPCTAYDGCARPTPVHYCEHPAGHIWPDFGSAAMWAFFSTFVE